MHPNGNDDDWLMRTTPILPHSVRRRRRIRRALIVLAIAAACAGGGALAAPYVDMAVTNFLWSL